MLLLLKSAFAIRRDCDVWLAGYRDNLLRFTASEQCSRIFGVLCGAGAAAIWAGSSVVSRYLITSNFSAIELTAMRYGVCFPIALLIFALWYPILVNKLSWKAFIIVTVLAGPPFHCLVIAGYAYIPAGLGAVLVAGLLALFTLIIAPFWEGSFFHKAQLAAVGLVLVGLSCLVPYLQAPHLQAISLDGEIVNDGVPVIGIFIFALASLLWALLNRVVNAWDIDPLSMTINLALTAPLFLPFYWLFSSSHAHMVVSDDIVLLFIYHGIFVSIVATFLFFIAIRRLGAESGALLLALVPVLAIFFGWFFLDERLSGFSFLGIALVLAGFAVTLMFNKANN